MDRFNIRKMTAESALFTGQKKTPDVPESRVSFFPPLVLSRSGHGSLISGRFQTVVNAEYAHHQVPLIPTGGHKYCIKYCLKPDR
jgi:hypothetical protein